MSNYIKWLMKHRAPLIMLMLLIQGLRAIFRYELIDDLPLDLLQVYFWTSSPALPASEEGFQPMPSITIRPADDDHLPTANTCISRLYIPLYSSKVVLRSKIILAIKTKAFGFVQPQCVWLTFYISISMTHAHICENRTVIEIYLALEESLE